jgi:hypothetical protein
LRHIRDVFEGYGIVLECEDGASDEGDPWLAYVDVQDGAFFAHIARIGLFYLLLWADETSAFALNLSNLLSAAHRGFSNVRQSRAAF